MRAQAVGGAPDAVRVARRAGGDDRGVVVDFGEMRDHVAHEPALARRGALPDGVVGAGERVVEVALLGGEVVEEGLPVVGHGCTVSRSGPSCGWPLV